MALEISGGGINGKNEMITMAPPPPPPPTDDDNNDPSCLIELPLKEECAATFNLEDAVCNHGLFMMAPNIWIPSTKTLQRPLRLISTTSIHEYSSTSLTVSISHPLTTNNHSISTISSSTSLRISVHGTKHLSSQDQQAILAQVTRMLRITEKDEREVQKFQEMSVEAKKRGFGRLFRSPTLFEDAVKSILLRNCTWARTLKMCQALCDLQLELASGKLAQDTSTEDFNKHTKTTRRKAVVKRERSTTKTASSTENHEDDEVKKNGSNPPVLQQSQFGDFPSAKELASLSAEYLQKRCNLGYRAENIVSFAKSVQSNRLRLKELEDEVCDDQRALFENVYRKLMKVKGFGPFTCANVLMCMGFYERVPQDTETNRHLSQCLRRKVDKKKRSATRKRSATNHQKKRKRSATSTSVGTIVKDIYGEYAPFQCLAYWSELLEYYESKLGKLSKLPRSSYGAVAGHIDNALPS